MNRLRLRRNVLRDQFLALGKNLAQRTDVSVRTGFFERSPFHNEQWPVFGDQKGKKPVLATDHQLLTTAYIPGNFIPAILRAKLGLPICLNIFFICAYWRSRLFTSCTLVPEPREMRLRRLPLITS